MELVRVMLPPEVMVAAPEMPVKPLRERFWPKRESPVSVERGL